MRNHDISTVDSQRVLARKLRRLLHEMRAWPKNFGALRAPLLEPPSHPGYAPAVIRLPSAMRTMTQYRGCAYTVIVRTLAF